jgi:hypothetical protein
MRTGNSPLEVALALLEDGLPEENLSAALAAHAPVAGNVDGDLPFAVAD